MADATDAEMLSLVKAAIAGTLTRNAAALRTATGRHVQSLPMSDLLAMRKDLESRVAQAAGCIRPRPVRFRRPS